MLDPEDIAPEGFRRITREEFEKLGQTDFFDDDERVELIRGVLVTPPHPYPPHDEVVQRLTRLLVLGIRERAWVRVNAAFAADDYSQVLPDLAVVPLGNYRASRPETALLLVEVAASSLRKDRRVKAPLYAESGVPEYWIANVAERILEVHTNPEGGVYRRITSLKDGESTRLTAFPDVLVQVEEVFGPMD